jgi:hypothetical protein
MKESPSFFNQGMKRKNILYWMLLIPRALGDMAPA